MGGISRVVDAETVSRPGNARSRTAASWWSAALAHPTRPWPSSASQADEPDIPELCRAPCPHPAACLGIRFSVGCALIIPMIILTIGLYPSGAVWTDGPTNVSRLDPSGAVQVDAQNPTRNRKVDGSSANSGL